MTQVMEADIPDARLGPDRVPEPKAIVLAPGRSASEGQTRAPFPCAVCRMRMLGAGGAHLMAARQRMNLAMPPPASAPG